MAVATCLLLLLVLVALCIGRYSISAAEVLRYLFLGIEENSMLPYVPVVCRICARSAALDLSLIHILLIFFHAHQCMTDRAYIQFTMNKMRGQEFVLQHDEQTDSPVSYTHLDVYKRQEVTDTGCGIPPEEREEIFLCLSV